MRQQRLAVLISALLAAVPPLSAQTLKGSRESMQRQYQLAVSYGYTFLKTPASVRGFVNDGYLVEVRPSRTMALHAVSYPYARPEVKLFVERLSEQYMAACGEKMTVTSLTRPINLQPANASSDSVHPTGMAVDLRVPADPKCNKWLEGTLLSLEGTGVLDVTREYHPPHFHVAVYTKIYGNYVASLEASQPAGIGASEYVVQRGDTLSRIADRTGVSVAALRGANSLRNDMIRVGQKLSVPGQADTATLQVASAPTVPMRADDSYSSGALPVEAVAAVAVRNAATVELGNGSYVVKRGDSLARIAERTGTTVADLRRSNGLRGNVIHPGQTLQIPGQLAVETTTAQVAQSDSTAPASYVVRRGDSLASIASRAGLTVDDLRQLNGVRGTVIYPGQTLRLMPEPAVANTVAQVTVPPMSDSIAPVSDTAAVVASTAVSDASAIVAPVAPQAETITATVAPTVAVATNAVATTVAATTTTDSSYVVRKGDTLGNIATRTGLTVDDLRKLNALKGNLIHPGQTLRLAPGNTATVAPVLVATVPLPEPATADTVDTDVVEAGLAPTPASYVVRKGDSLATIAARAGLTIDDLRRFNALRGTVIHPGQTLALAPDNDPAGATTADATLVASVAPAVSGSASYMVRKGDTLSTIATRTGTSIMTLRQANGLRNDRIVAGQTLVVPTLASLEPIDGEALVAVEHEVRRGESLWHIANRYGTTVSSLRQDNDLPGDNLTVGQILRVTVALTTN